VTRRPPASAGARTEAAHLQALSLVSFVCGRIAHDLNNLLAAVDGYAEFAAQDVADRPQVLSDITEVRSAAKKGAAFSRRLRQVGQLDEGAPEEVDLTRLVEEAQEQIRLVTGELVQPVFALKPGLPAVWADAGQLQLALLGLVENSVEAMPDGGKIKVETFLDGKDVALRITDQGMGMSEEVQAKVFQPFYSTKPKAIGNGLGMFIVDAVVERAGGRIEIESEEGAGTIVTLCLPATT
jgi:two-component system cell cycle sensor histidine kinase/response regulator CckA